MENGGDTEEREGKGWTERERERKKDERGEERRGKRNRNEAANPVQGRISRRENDTS